MENDDLASSGSATPDPESVRPGAAITACLSIMCCGCNRFLAKEGAPVEAASKVPPKGFIDFQWMYENLKVLRERGIAEFPSEEAADAHAVGLGWTVKDPDGAYNHRCPDCQKKPATRKRGAFIFWNTQNPLLVGRDTPHEATPPTEAKTK